MEIKSHAKIVGANAHLVFAIISGLDILRAVYVGPSDEVKAVNANFVTKAREGMTLIIGNKLATYYRPDCGSRISRIKVEEYFAGIFETPERLANVLLGTTEMDFYDRAHTLVQEKTSIPIAREWMRVIWPAMVNRGVVRSLQVLGADESLKGYEILDKKLTKGFVSEVFFEDPEIMRELAAQEAVN